MFDNIHTLLGCTLFYQPAYMLRERVKHGLADATTNKKKVRRLASTLYKNRVF